MNILFNAGADPSGPGGVSDRQYSIISYGLLIFIRKGRDGMKLSLKGMQNAKEKPDFRRQKSRIRFIYGIGIQGGENKK